MARAPLTKEEIEKLNNIADVFKLLTIHGIPFEGVTDVKGAQRLLMAKYYQQSGATMRKPGDGAVVMAGALDVDKKRRKELLSLLSSIQGFLRSLEPDVIQQLDFRCGHGGSVRAVLGYCEHKLRKDDCPILVAGETSAGKSTLLNVLLGEPLLPTSVLSTTSIICELKHGRPQRAVFHRKGHGPATRSRQETVLLDGSTEENMKKLSDKVHLKGEERETAPDYEKVEIYWPLALLEGGIFIVDSPGVGESKLMDGLVSQYIGQACAFIYVLNSSNAGGVQPGKLQSLLANCREKHPEDMQLFDPKTAVFVCNKWDQVPDKEREQVRAEIIRQLEKHWSRNYKLDPKSQVFCLSATEAEKAQEVGYVAEDLEQLLEGIDALLPQSLRHKLTMQYCIIVKVVQELHKILKVKLHNAHKTKEQREAEAKSIRVRLEMFKQYADEVMQRLDEQLQQHIADANHDLLNNLCSDEMREEIVEEAMKQAPTLTKEEEKDWKGVRSTTVNLVSHLIEEKVQAWDSTNMYFDRMEHNLIDNFKKEFHLIEDRHHEEIQKALDPDLKTGPAKKKNRVTADDDDLSMPTGGKIALGVTAPLWIPLTVATGLSALVLALPVVAFVAAKENISEALERSRFIKMYRNEESRKRYFEDLTSKALNGISEDRELQSSLVEKRLSKPIAILNNLKEAIPNLVAADKNLLDVLAAESRGQDFLLSLYLPLVKGCRTLQGQMEMFELKFLSSCKNNLDKILNDKTQKIGSGQFGDVFKVKVSRGKKTVDAAIKVAKEPITVNNVTSFLQEKNNLRFLNHANVLEYYATATAIHEDYVRVGIVTELCQATLMEWLQSYKERTPARWGDETQDMYGMYIGAFLNIREIGTQLCEGLSYIHGEGYIHRDLKADNILVTAGGIVKLADLGLTKKMVDQTGTMCGTPVYAAPEVFAENMDYDQSADIYSLGFVLLEIWYGVPVYEDQVFLKKITEKADLPSQLFLSYLLPPIQQWQKLIKKCFNKDKDSRPSALVCLKELKGMKLPGFQPQ
ncbi:PREDICTED: uncharacterized protein LOC109464099 [Branchiostoma belcheri]|uniref:Uncharacterized protein LOC109464099 n=1 Tax=Branchiostoma belcheri TaxID=7741 RepID=A0A6P4XJ86_BRABE|nr:PREDICTED: uncharacterized protein LOC109464099 [Branchiostoma belcheri]